MRVSGVSCLSGRLMNLLKTVLTSKDALVRTHARLWMNLPWPIERRDWCQRELQWIIPPRMSTGCHRRVKAHNPHRLMHTITDKEKSDMSAISVQQLSRRNWSATSPISKPVVVINKAFVVKNAFSPHCCSNNRNIIRNSESVCPHMNVQVIFLALLFTFLVWEEHGLISFREKWPKGVTVNMHTDPAGVEGRGAVFEWGRVVSGST